MKKTNPSKNGVKWIGKIPTEGSVTVGSSSGLPSELDLSAKGSIIVGDGTTAPTALAVGSNDYVLTADSNEATGLKWKAGGSGDGDITGVTITTDSGANSKAEDDSGSADFIIQGSNGVGVTNSGTTITATAVPGEIDHDSLNNFVAAEHVNWAADGAGTIHASNYTDTNTQLSQAQVEDFAGGLFTNNTEAGITATYQTEDNTVDLAVSLDAGDLSDVDTSNVAANDILVWNGSSFVVESMATMMGNNTLFTFALSSFNDGISGDQLIGSGTWQAAGAINFSAVYVAGPPDTSATIQKSINGADYTNMNSMVSAAFTSGNNGAAVGYPSSKDQTLQFRLKVVNGGADPVYAYGGALNFRNKVFWGPSTAATIDEDGIEGLSSATTNSHLSSRYSINSSSGKYVYIAFPANYSDVHADGFQFKNITCPFGSKATVTITNTAGYQEDYDVYRSANAGLGSGTLDLSTSATLNNTIFYGKTTATSSIDVDSFVSSPGEATNADITRQWPSITTGAGQYMLFAWPARFTTDPIFNVGGFDGGFESATTANFTNDNGYTESYKFFIASNPNLGTQTVTTR